jgi:hypothetical protein
MGAMSIPLQLFPPGQYSDYEAQAGYSMAFHLWPAILLPHHPSLQYPPSHYAGVIPERI